MALIPFLFSTSLANADVNSKECIALDKETYEILIKCKKEERDCEFACNPKKNCYKELCSKCDKKECEVAKNSCQLYKDKNQKWFDECYKSKR